MPSCWSSDAQSACCKRRLVSSGDVNTCDQPDADLQIQLNGGKLNVQALKGALVGPPWSKRQYGWHFTEAVENGVTVYYEPHANHDLQSVQSVGQVDIAVIPTESTYAAGACFWRLYKFTAACA